MPKTPPYSKEFKREAVQLLRTSGRPVPQLAKELGVSQGSLRNWASQLDVDDGKAEGLSSAERDELRRLRRENKILAEEREILKMPRRPRRFTARPLTRKAIARIAYPLQAGALGLITGEVGCGKTTALRAASAALDDASRHIQ